MSPGSTNCVTGKYTIIFPISVSAIVAYVIGIHFTTIKWRALICFAPGLATLHITNERRGDK